MKLKSEIDEDEEASDQTRTFSSPTVLLGKARSEEAEYFGQTESHGEESSDQKALTETRSKI